MLIRFGAIGIVTVAAIQWWQLADRALHIVRMYWKFETFPVAAGEASLVFFLICSAVGAALGWYVLLRARNEGGWPYHVSRASTAALILGGVLWPALIASPLVRLIER